MECPRKRFLRFPRNLPSRFHCTASPSRDQPLIPSAPFVVALFLVLVLPLVKKRGKKRNPARKPGLYTVPLSQVSTASSFRYMYLYASKSFKVTGKFTANFFFVLARRGKETQPVLHQEVTQTTLFLKRFLANPRSFRELPFLSNL